MITGDKTCAFFRRQWWDTAKAHLNDSERLTLYESVFSFQFDGEVSTETLSPMVAMLFDLIRPTLAADREKMQRRAETARANGMAGGRPRVVSIDQNVTKPSGLNENPVGFFGLANTMSNMQDTIANSNLCVQATEINEDRHTKFLVCIEFFLMGVADPVEEGQLFWNYYDARGWVAGDGQPIKNVLSLAKSWRPKNLLVAKAKKRLPFRSLFKLLEMPDFSLFERLLSCEVDGSTSSVFLFVKTKEDAEYLETRHIDLLSRWVKTCDGRDEKWGLVYRFSTAEE